MSDILPPIPNYLMGQGITREEYIQDSDIQKARMKSRAMHRLNRYPTPRALHIGRPLLENRVKTLSNGKIRNDNLNYSRQLPGFRYLGSGDSFSNDNIRDIWSAQVIALWLTDGRVFDQFKMNGVVSLNGFTKQNISPLRPQSNGRVIEDILFLRKLPSAAIANDAPYVMGPDGIFGTAVESIISEYVRTGKLFGEAIPSQLIPVYARLARNYTSNAIENAKRQAQAGQTRPSERAADTPTHMLTGDAQRAAGLAVTGNLYNDLFTQSPASSDTPSSPTNSKAARSDSHKHKLEDTSSDNVYLYLSIGLIATFGATGYLIYRKRKSRS